MRRHLPQPKAPSWPPRWTSCPASRRCAAGACCSPRELEGGDAAAVQRELLASGLVTNAVTPTALRLAPPLTVTDAELDEAVAIMRQVLA